MSSASDDEMSPEQCVAPFLFLASFDDVIKNACRTQKLAENAKKKGNASFTKGDYVAAIKSYSMVRSSLFVRLS
jgi:hypothetical protein